MYFKDTVTTIDITTPKNESVSNFTKNSKEPGNWLSLNPPQQMGKKSYTRYHNEVP